MKVTPRDWISEKPVSVNIEKLEAVRLSLAPAPLGSTTGTADLFIPGVEKYRGATNRKCPAVNDGQRNPSPGRPVTPASTSVSDAAQFREVPRGHPDDLGWRCPQRSRS